MKEGLSDGGGHPTQLLPSLPPSLGCSGHQETDQTAFSSSLLWPPPPNRRGPTNWTTTTTATRRRTAAAAEVEDGDSPRVLRSCRDRRKPLDQRGFLRPTMLSCEGAFYRDAPSETVIGEGVVALSNHPESASLPSLTNEARPSPPPSFMFDIPSTHKLGGGGSESGRSPPPPLSGGGGGKNPHADGRTDCAPSRASDRDL